MWNKGLINRFLLCFQNHVTIGLNPKKPELDIMKQNIIMLSLEIVFYNWPNDLNSNNIILQYNHCLSTHINPLLPKRKNLIADIQSK